MRQIFCAVLLSSLMAAGSAGAMTYRQIPFQDGSIALMATGRIEVNELQTFAYAMQVAAVQGAAPGTLIVASPGGNMGGAIRLGLAVRKLGMKTVVGRIMQMQDGQRSLSSGDCHSACVLVFMAGTDRSVLSGSRVGVHSPSVAIPVDEATKQALLAKADPGLREYAREMGVRPELISVANTVPSTSIRTLTSSELSRYQLVTGRSATRAGRAARTRSVAAKRQKRRAS